MRTTARRAIATHVNLGISSLGERLGSATLTYHPGTMRGFDYFARENAPGFAARLIETFGPVRYMDVGAGTGRFADALRSAGASVDACEHSGWARRIARRRGIEMTPFRLECPDPGPSRNGYDVAICLEVAEHLHPILGDRLVDYLSAFPVVVFTAAHPGQGGTGHVNEQPKTYWQQRFFARGHKRNPELERKFLDSPGEVPFPWLLENLTIYAQWQRLAVRL